MSARAAGPVLKRSLWARSGLAQEQGVARFHRQSDRRRLQAMVKGLLGTGVLVGLVLGVVGLRIQQVRLSYRIDGLRTVRAGMEETQSQLSVELATLKSLARIEGMARTELGMVVPARDQVRVAREFVPRGGGLHAGVPLTASAEDLARSGSGAR
jgi:cell division protein FtsL